MRVTAPADKGRANEAALELLASALAVPRQRLAIVSGTSAREKIVRLDGLGAEEAERRLRASLGARRR